MREMFKKLISLALIFLIVFMPYTNVIDVEMFKVSASETCGPDDYVLAKDTDFSGTSNGQFRYIGSGECVEIPHVIKGVNVTSYRHMFNGKDVKGVLSTNKNVTDMSYMFYGSQVTSLDLSSFDTSNVMFMSFMFRDSQATSLDLSSFDTSNVMFMDNMFRNSQATSLDLSSFDTSNVTNMNWMFRDSQATSLDLSSFDTSNVAYMTSMFQSSQATKGYARTQEDANKFNNSLNKPSGLIFEEKYKLATDDDFSGDTNGNFRYIGSDEYVEIPHVIKGVNVTSYRHMFNGKDVKGVLSTNKNVTDMSYMFGNSQATTLDLSSFDTSSVTDMRSMFYNSRATSLDLSNFVTSKVTNMSYMFNRSSATELDLSSFVTSKVTNMSYMFNRSSATELDLSSFDTSNVTNMKDMFKGVSIDELDATDWDTSKVKDMSGMFSWGSSASGGSSEHNVKSVRGIENWNLQSVTNIDDMFKYTRMENLWEIYKIWGSKGYFDKLESFRGMFSTANQNSFPEEMNLREVFGSEFDYSNIKNMSGMFEYNQASSIIFPENFDTSNVTNMGNMFYGSQAITLDLSSFDTSNVDNMSGMFRDSQATKGYARTQADADKLNGSSNKPDPLNFVIIGTPVISFSGNENSTYKKTQSTTVNVDWSKGEKETLEYQWTNSSSFPSGGTWTNFNSGNTITKQSGTGDFYLHIRAKSEQNITEEKTSNVFKLDNENPGITNLNNSYSFNYRDENKEISFNISDQHSGLDKIEYQLKNSNNQSIDIRNQNKSFNNTKSENVKLTLPSNLDEGEYTLNVKVYDKAGNSFERNVNITIEGTLELEISGDVSNNKIDFGNLTLNGQDTQESDSRQIDYKITDTRQNPGWTLQMSYSGFEGGDPGTKLLVRDRAGGQSLEVENQLITIDSGNSVGKTIKKNLSIQIPKTTKAGEYNTTIQITLINGF